MLSNEFFKKWYQEFASTVDKHIMQENVKASGCMPWHIFTWGKIPSVIGEKALDEFLKLSSDQKVFVFTGFDYENDWVEEYDSMDKRYLTHLMHIDNINNEVFVTAQDFSWTFVWTHEGYYCGPFLCYKENIKRMRSFVLYTNNK